MEVYFLRHGKAQSGSSSGKDFDRELHPDGRKDIQTLAQRLNQMKIQFDNVFSSPLVRAKQTAEILCEHLKTNPRFQLTDDLACGAKKEDILNIINQEKNKKSILFIGHMPDLGEIIAQLIYAPSSLSLKAGALCRLDINQPFDGKKPSELTLFISPENYHS